MISAVCELQEPLDSRRYTDNSGDRNRKISRSSSPVSSGMYLLEYCGNMVALYRKKLWCQYGDFVHTSTKKV